MTLKKSIGRLTFWERLTSLPFRFVSYCPVCEKRIYLFGTHAPTGGYYIHTKCLKNFDVDDIKRRSVRLTDEETAQIRAIINKHIAGYWGDLFRDNEVSIKFDVKGDAYVQLN